MTGEGVLECCGVLTSEQGRDEPSWDSISASAQPPRPGLREGGGLLPATGAGREEPSGTQAGTGFREGSPEARAGAASLAGSPPEQVIRVRLAPARGAPPSRGGFTPAGRSRPGLRGTRRGGDPRW